MPPDPRAPIECEGAPRDLGLDQGRALSDRIRQQLEALHGEGHWLRDRLRWPGSTRGSRGWRDVARDLRRHYPHLAERTAGLRDGARVSWRALAVALARELGDEGDGVLRLGGGSALGAVPARTSMSGALLARSFDLPRSGAPEPCLRVSRPDAGYTSLDVILPGFGAALAGVNEHGLAATVTTIPSSEGHRSACAAPAMLLVQECLQRFDCVAAAVDWCMARPAGGRASVLLADLEGDLRAVRIEGERRRMAEPSEGVVLGVGRRHTLVELDKCCRGPGRLDPDRLREILAWHGDDGRPDEDTPCRHGELRTTSGTVVVDAAARRVELRQGPPCRPDTQEPIFATL